MVPKIAPGKAEGWNVAVVMYFIADQVDINETALPALEVEHLVKHSDSRQSRTVTDTCKDEQTEAQGTRRTWRS